MQGKGIDISRCPKCNKNISRVWETGNTFKCERGCLLRLVFESEIRPIASYDKPMWLDQENKEYPAIILTP